MRVGPMKSKQIVRALAIAMTLNVMAGTTAVSAHGDGAPQPVDTTGLEPLGAELVGKNPYSGNARAIEVGGKGYNSNCARCHGLDVKSGGLAPDLRALPVDEATDAYFITRVLRGAKRDDRVKMPPFEGILSQEAIWAIRTFIDSQPDD